MMRGMLALLAASGALAALREALAAPDTIERMAKDGTEPRPSTPAEYAAEIDREETKWSAVVKRSGARAE